MRALALAAALALPGALATLDPAFGEEGDPRVTHVCTVEPEVIALTIRAGRVEYGRPVAYAKQPGDKVDRKGHQRWVWREGKFLGSLVGRDENILHTPDRLVGKPIDAAALDDPKAYDVKHDAKLPPWKPAAVYRKTKPTDLARTGHWRYKSPTVTVVYLKMPVALPGKKISVTNARAPWLKATFTMRYNGRKVRSEAVHVSHLGFRPDDPAKVAFLSCWMGTGGALEYPAGLDFEVVDVKTGKPEFKGKTKLAKAAADRTEDAYKKNHNGTDVYGMDFSGLRRAGEYVIAVDGVGCSYPFKIDKDAWREAFATSARGLYHQRSGIALGPPHTDFRRPKCFRPGPSFKVLHTMAALMDTGNGLNRKDSNFGRIVKGKTAQVVANAWGGYMDAGDWDRRIQHLECSRLLLELAEIFPDYFKALDLNIPESRDGLPDVVSEALFNLDCYRRMQTPDGGIRGGIESSEHPRQGEGSWQESLDVYAYAPGAWSSYEYAGTAARAAYVLEKLKSPRAAVYRASALRAMEWAEREWPKLDLTKYPHALKDSRNLAAAEMFRMTGERRWHDLFIETTVFATKGTLLYVWKKHEQSHSAWVYLRTKRPGMREDIRANCREALITRADDRVKWCFKTGFRWTKNPWRPIGWGALTVPDAVDLCRAHALTGDAKYLRAAVLACQTGAGANPANMCYTTGLGHESPLHPLHIDSRITHQPPPPGITVYGPIDTAKTKDEWGQKLANQTLHPKGDQWPTAEAFWDIFWFPGMCEFTVMQTIGPNAYVWGYLAARE